MQRLTKTEEEVMHYIWELGECLVSDIIAEMPDKKPPHSTISSIVRILEKKGFVDHKTYGRTHLYFPKVSKEDYSKRTLSKFIRKYFEGSAERMVSFLVEEEELSKEDLEQLIDSLSKSK